MRFWDASALVPLLTEEPTSAACRALAAEDAPIVVWWGTAIECASALCRREREGALDARQADDTLRRLDALLRSVAEVQPLGVVRAQAHRVLRVHPLRTADSLQLGAAIVASEFRPASLPFVTQDARLADAAAREGFPVVRVA